jgi:hypothetical protein
MSSSPHRFIEDDHQDTRCLTATGLLIHLNSRRTTGTFKRVQALQAMLSLHQRRVSEQQAALQALGASKSRSTEASSTLN